MVYLQDADNASRLFALELSGVRQLSAARSGLLKRTVARNVSGHLGQIADKLAAVYVAGGQLWLAIDDQPWLLEELSAEIERADNSCSVQISTPKRDYRFFVDGTESDADTTAFASVEDRSFGLWAARIIESRERQNVLLEALVDAPLDEVPDHAKTEAHDGPVNARHSWSGSTLATDRPSSRKRSAE
jgi:hypothetical protein